jgi:hypothetical protein
MPTVTTTLIVSIGCLSCSAAASGHVQRAVRDDSTIIVMLGTGNPRPLPDVMGPATAVTVGERVF